MRKGGKGTIVFHFEEGERIGDLPDNRRAASAIFLCERKKEETPLGLVCEKKERGTASRYPHQRKREKLTGWGTTSRSFLAGGGGGKGKLHPPDAMILVTRSRKKRRNPLDFWPHTKTSFAPAMGRRKKKGERTAIGAMLCCQRATKKGNRVSNGQTKLRVWSGEAGLKLTSTEKKEKGLVLSRCQKKREKYSFKNRGT